MALRKRGTVQTQIEAEGIEKYEADMRRAEGALDSVASGTQGLDKAMRSAGGAFAVASAGVAVGVQVWREVIDLGRTAIDVYGQLGMRGGSLAAIAGYYEQIAAPGLLDRMQRLSGWHINQERIMATYNVTMQRQLVTANEFSEWLQRTTFFAQVAGDDISQMWTQVSRGLGGESMEVLQRLGINMRVVRDRVQAAGIEWESAAGKAMALDLSLEQLRSITGEASNAASNLADTWEATSVQAGDFYDRVARIVSTSPAAVNAFEAFREKLFGIDGAARMAGHAIAEMARTTIIMMARTVESTAQAAGFMSRIALQVGALFPEAEDVPAFMRRSLERVDELRELHRGVVEVSGEIAAAAIATRQAAIAAPAMPELGAGGQRPIVPLVGAGRRPGAEIQFEILDFNQMIAEALARIDELSREINDSEQLYLDIIGTQVELEQERVDIERERFEQELERATAIGEAWEEIRQKELEAQEAAAEAAAQRQQQLLENLSTITQSTNTLAGIFGTIAQQQEAAGKASDQWRKAEGVAKGIYYTMEAIGAGAKAVGAAASFNVVGAIAHGIEAAQYGIAAGIAFNQLAQGAGGAGAGAGAATSAGTFIPARTDMMTGPQRPAVGGNTYNIYTMGGRDFSRQVGRAEYMLQRSGVFAQRPSQGVSFEG